MEILMPCHAGLEKNDEADRSAGLIARVKSGDRDAFGLIFELHHRFIFKFIFAMAGEQRLAEELTQETFLAAYKGIDNLRGEAKLQTWLCGIAKNLVYKSFRASRLERQNSDQSLESHELVDQKTPAPDRQYLDKELNSLIALVLKDLDADKRLVFTLKEFQHLPYAEISEITGFSIAKLKIDLHRAKAVMRERLGAYLEKKK